MKYYSLAIAIVLGAMAQIFLKNGAKGFSFNINSVNIWLIAGIITYAISVLFWINAIKYIPLSTAYPCISLSYILILILGHFLFNETISLQKIMAILFILTGVTLLFK